MWTIGALIEEARRVGMMPKVANSSSSSRDHSGDDQLAAYANEALMDLCMQASQKSNGVFVTRFPNWLVRRVDVTIETVNGAAFIFMPTDCANMLALYPDSSSEFPLWRHEYQSHRGGDYKNEGDRLRMPSSASGTKSLEYITSGANMFAQGATASATSSTLVATATSYASVPLATESQYYQLLTLKIVSGTGSGQRRRVAAYTHDGSQGTFTVSSDWTTTPDTTSVWAIEAPFPSFADRLLVYHTLKQVPDCTRFEALIPAWHQYLKNFTRAVQRAPGIS